MIKVHIKQFSPKIATFLAALLVLFAFAPGAIASDDPFEGLASSLVSYFKPFESKITTIQGVMAEINIGADAGVMAGMRLKVSRKGSPFRHPITKEPYGYTEAYIGKAEVVEVRAGSASIKMLGGRAAAADDVVRLSSAKVRTVFYQTNKVEWNLSEKYYWYLVNTGRFEIIDMAPGDASDYEITSAAMELEGEIVVVLTSSRKDDSTVLVQRVLWVEDGSTLYEEQAVVTADMLADLRLGNELFTPRKTYTITYELPTSARIIEAGDIDGDGQMELLVSTRSEIDFFTPGTTLENAFKGVKIERHKGETNLWIDLYDLDSDGADEIVVTSIRDKLIISRIYKLQGKEIKSIWEGKVFLRVINGTLHAQASRRGLGFDGPVTPINWQTGTTEVAGDALKLPPGVNIYDFSYIRTPSDERAIIAYDAGGSIVLYDENGAPLWRTYGSYGGAQIVFDKDKNLSLDDLGQWYISDRIHISGRTGLAIRRIPLTQTAKGLGIRRSLLVGFRWVGPTLQESVIINRIPGNVEDIAMIDGKVFVLAHPLLGLDAKKLLKGKNPMVNKLYIYSLKGQ